MFEPRFCFWVGRDDGKGIRCFFSFLMDTGTWFCACIENHPAVHKPAEPCVGFLVAIYHKSSEGGLNLKQLTFLKKKKKREKLVESRTSQSP